MYLYVLFGLMAPWSVFIPAALLEVHRKVRKAASSALADADLFALIYFWGTLAFFTLSRSRRSLLPAADSARGGAGGRPPAFRVRL